MDDDSTIVKGDSVTPEQRRNSRRYVRDLLGDPDAVDRPLENLPFDMRISLAMIRVVDDVADIKENGCSKRPEDIDRIRALEGWGPMIKFAGASVLAVGVVIAFVWTMIQFAKKVM